MSLTLHPSNRRATHQVRAVVFACAMATVPVLPASAQERRTPCERFGSEPAVFVGETGETTRHRITVKVAPDVPPIDVLALSITVERSFRGVAASGVVYLPLDGVMPAALAPGRRRYLVYGAFNFGELTDVVTPALMMPIEEAADDLAFLEAANASSGTGSISGVLVNGNTSSDGPRRQSIPGVTIRFRSGDTTVDAVSDDAGRYAVFDLPEGSVRIELLLPDHSLRNGSAQIRAGGCTGRDLYVELNGRIRGRVLRPDSSPMTWMVSVVPVDPQREGISRDGRSVRADKSGEYEFSALPPGEYLVGVNLNRPPGTGAPFPPTYYPGTVRQEDAVPVVVGQGTVHEAVDFTLVETIRAGKLEIRIKGVAGAATTVVCLRDAGGSGGTYPQSEAGAPIMIDVLEGSRYQFVAHVEHATGHVESDIVELTGAAGHQTLTLSANRQGRDHPVGNECAPF